MMLKDKTIQEFLDEVALKPLTPAGGSVAALTAASSAALIEIIARITMENPEYEEMVDEMNGIIKACELYRKDFMIDMDRDAQAFQEVMAAFKLPKDTKAHQEYRKSEIEDKMKQAINVPLEICQKTCEMVNLIKKVVNKGNKSTVTDGLEAAFMAKAVVLCLIEHIKSNLNFVKDVEFTSKILRKIDKLYFAVSDLEKLLMVTNVTK